MIALLLKYLAKCFFKLDLDMTVLVEDVDGLGDIDFIVETVGLSTGLEAGGAAEILQPALYLYECLQDLTACNNYCL